MNNGFKFSGPEKYKGDANLHQLDKEHFRVVVFGSARIKPGDEIYEAVFALGKGIGALGADVVTGGGPGIMEAANKGHRAGATGKGGSSIGVGIKLPFEESMNKHLDLQEEHEFFSSRLDTFMRLSNIVVVAPGGIGTLLELAYTWQLIQVGHICRIPIVTIGESWMELRNWADKYLIKGGLANAKDLEVITCAKDFDHALEIVKKTKDLFEEGCYDQCINWEKYKGVVEGDF